MRTPSSVCNQMPPSLLLWFSLPEEACCPEKGGKKQGQDIGIIGQVAWNSNSQCSMREPRTEARGRTREIYTTHRCIPLHMPHPSTHYAPFDLFSFPENCFLVKSKADVFWVLQHEQKEVLSPPNPWGHSQERGNVVQCSVYVCVCACVCLCVFQEGRGDLSIHLP